MDYVKISVNVTDTQKRKLQAAADAAGCNVSTIIRLLINKLQNKKRSNITDEMLEKIEKAVAGGVL